MTKRFAFTLAEVLIALAIIGVVAAMTIPTFMANTAGAQFRTGFKKGITVLTQAASANYATEGYDFGGTIVPYGTTTEATATTPEYITATPLNTTGLATYRVGFNTEKTGTADSDHDLDTDVQSIFHLFQGNLNMKNSNEVTNYDVGMPDVMLSCDPTAAQRVATNITGTGAATAPQFTPVAIATLATRQGGAVAQGGTATIAQLQQGQGGLRDLCAGSSVTGDGVGGINQGRMFMLEDGMVFTYDPGQTACTENNPCYGYLDVNGAQGPNRVISCSEGANSYIPSYGREYANATAHQNELLATCTVNAKDTTDIFPVLFYGQTVKPASIAAKSVLYSQKSNQAAAN